jgi:HD-GYP domain-containing protein (c-di-GMP phosphodiesterase class II)
MAKIKTRAAVPDNISEEYYQISHDILQSFSKYRPPVDLFQFREDIKQLYPFSRKGQRLTNEQVDQAQALCDDQSLFVSRADHPIYSEHMVKQVDLVLLDSNLKAREVADIIIRALLMRLGDFFEQPVMPVFELLYRDLMVYTEYVSQDKYRAKLFMRRLFTEHTLTNHSVNSLIIGIWLFVNGFAPADFKRRNLDRAALGLLLHDIGMSKLPGFILSKAGPLKQEEREKIVLHPLAGLKSLQKLNLDFDELHHAIMEHHERLDGSGYPQKVKEISKFGALVAVADSFSAMISTRMYAPAKPALEAAKELSTDKRYDAKLATTLANAYLTGAFDVSKDEENAFIKPVAPDPAADPEPAPDAE